MDAASGLLKTSVDLFNLLDASYRKFKQLPEDVKFIQSELRSIDEVIIMSSGSADHNLSSSWIHDLKEIRRSIEDAVDFYNYEVICEDDDPGFLYGTFQTTMTLLGPRSKLSKDIEDIKRLIAEAKERKRYRDDLQQANQAANNGAYQHADEAEPQGLETPKEELLQLLGTSLERPTKLRVIAISGLGGSGKTILAKAVFNQVYKEFDCYSWVTASKDGVNKILMDIFYSMKPPPPSEGTSNHLSTGLPPSEDNITDHLRKLLEDKRCDSL